MYCIFFGLFQEERHFDTLLDDVQVGLNLPEGSIESGVCLIHECSIQEPSLRGKMMDTYKNLARRIFTEAMSRISNKA